MHPPHCSRAFFFSVGRSPDGSYPHSLLNSCELVMQVCKFYLDRGNGKTQKKLLLLCPTRTGCPIPRQAVTCTKGGFSNVLCSAGRTLDVPCHEQWVLLHLGLLPIERIMPPSSSRPLWKPSVHVSK